MLACIALALAGCATHIKSTLAENPPPAEAFSKFTHFTLGAARLVPPYAGQPANERALLKIQENLSAQMTPVLAQWNAAGAATSPKRTLLVDPVVTEIKFINGNSRFWAGPIAGSSAVILRVKISEYETGKVIATPEFYARASAMGGTWTIGATDNVMLTRIAGHLASYLKGNFAQAVGGPTGVDNK
jgi:hypothetical protein